MANSNTKARDALAHLLMTPESTPEPDQGRSDEKSQKAHTVQERESSVMLETPQAAGKNVNVAGPSPRDSIMQETRHTDVTTAGFHPNAFKDDDTSGLGDSNDDNHMDIDPKPQPDKFYLDIYKMATPDMFKLKDTNSAKKVMKLNKRIEAHNLQNKKPKMDFLIPLKTIAETMILYEDAKENNAEAKMNSLAEISEIQVERDFFPKEWKKLFRKFQSFQPVADGGISCGGGIQLEDSQDAAHNGGIRTKVGVQICDESDGQTLLGKVCFVKKCGYGSRVFVNCRTEKNPLYKVYTGSTFGAAAKKWVQNESFSCDPLALETPTKQIKLVAWIRAGRAQYYVVHVNNKAFLLTKSMLLKWLTIAQLKLYNPKIEYQMNAMAAQLQKHRNCYLHPDTGKRLTSQNIQDMPWLSNEGQDEDEDENEDEEGY